MSLDMTYVKEIGHKSLSSLIGGLSFGRGVMFPYFYISGR